MTGVPPEKLLTRAQIQRKVNVYRFLIAVFGRRTMGLWKKPTGTEMFLDTDVGRVRVLAYGLDDPTVRPLFVNIHGGGFVMGSAEMDDRFMPGIAMGAGVKILSIDYSLAPEAPFPVALEECYAVVKYAKEHAAELNIDPARMAVGGHSAGGNFSAALCLLDAVRKELGLRAVILDYPPLDIATDPYLKPRPKRRSLRRCRASTIKPTSAPERPLRTPWSHPTTPRWSRCGLSRPRW